MFRRLVVAVGVLAGAMVALPLSSAGAAPTTPSGDFTCPVNPNYPVQITANVVLTHDVTCTNPGTTFLVSPGIVVDLNGHTVTVPNNADRQRSCLLALDYCSFEVSSGFLRNGTLQNVALKGGTDDHLVIHGGLTKPRDGGSVSYSTIDGPVVMEGISSLSHDLIFSVVQLGDYNAGVFATVSDNVFWHGGILVQTIFFGRNDISGNIEHNVILGSPGSGIGFGGQLQDVGAFTISRNVIVGAKGDGITMSGGALDNSYPLPFNGGPVTIASNIVALNGGQGINAPWITDPLDALPTGIVDGGQNIAINDAAKPECVGVHCFP